MKTQKPLTGDPKEQKRGKSKAAKKKDGSKKKEDKADDEEEKDTVDALPQAKVAA